MFNIRHHRKTMVIICQYGKALENEDMVVLGLSRGQGAKNRDPESKWKQVLITILSLKFKCWQGSTRMRILLKRLAQILRRETMITKLRLRNKKVQRNRRRNFFHQSSHRMVVLKKAKNRQVAQSRSLARKCVEIVVFRLICPKTPEARKTNVQVNEMLTSNTLVIAKPSTKPTLTFPKADRATVAHPSTPRISTSHLNDLRSC